MWHIYAIFCFFFWLWWSKKTSFGEFAISSPGLVAKVFLMRIHGAVWFNFKPYLVKKEKKNSFGEFRIRSVALTHGLPLMGSHASVWISSYLFLRKNASKAKRLSERDKKKTPSVNSGFLQLNREVGFRKCDIGRRFEFRCSGIGKNVSRKKTTNNLFFLN